MTCDLKVEENREIITNIILLTPIKLLKKYWSGGDNMNGIATSPHSPHIWLFG